MAGEYDVDGALFEDGREPAELLLGEMRLGGVEAGLVETDEAPSGAAGVGEVVGDPFLEGGVLPVDVIVPVEHSPVGVSVVEGVIGGVGKGAAGAGFEGGGPFALKNGLVLVAEGGTIAGLLPIEVVGLGVGLLGRVGGDGVVVAGYAGEEAGAHQADAVGGVGIGVIDGV